MLNLKHSGIYIFLFCKYYIYTKRKSWKYRICANVCREVLTHHKGYFRDISRIVEYTFISKY